ncbi:glutaredoxin 2 [Salinimonas marina]|uniref:Glutaredoxin 2 n=1 Tax=Salinimonas marina TaxID=2785918 RepID=A0A7S9DY11_9ALTE|nr:glutaredoxin 2 [Salinimonas marina]QPG06054.1 glutaredoxin 2 [Salinimonas marina]
MVTLYQYLHCPYCVRADMVANYLNIDHKKVFLDNDDTDTGERLVGKKIVPILQLEDGSAMAESMDIVQHLVSMSKTDLHEGSGYQAHLQMLDDISQATRGLLYPRHIRVTQPEFETQSARDYFQHKKEDMLGMSFDEAFENTEAYQSQVEQTLAALPEVILPEERDNQLSWDDVMLFPILRNLTLVKDLKIPDQLRSYINQVSKLTNIKCYYDQAV